MSQLPMMLPRNVSSSRPWETVDREDLIARIKNRPVVVSISGGKDSTATAIYLRDLGIPARYVHMATGWEHPDTDRYVREVLPQIIGEIEIIDGIPELPPELEAEAVRIEAMMDGKPSAMVRRALQKAMFPSRVRRWCTQELKVRPFGRWARRTFGKDLTLAFVNAVGVRSQESAARSKLPAWDLDDDGYVVWRPLLDWTEDDIITFHHLHGITPNPLYLRGSARVGCWPCVLSRKSEIRAMADHDPARVDMIRELERVVTDIASRRASSVDSEAWRNGTDFRAFFGSPTYQREMKAKTAALAAEHPDWTPEECDAEARRWVSVQAKIDDVVAWSRTPGRGEDLDAEDLTGCTRWGFCETRVKD